MVSCCMLSTTVVVEPEPIESTAMEFNFGGFHLGRPLLCEDFLRNKGLSVAALVAVMLKPVSKHDQIAMSGLV
jgi:hypothetical protein